MLDGRGALVTQVLKERSAQGDIQQLLAAADPKRRQANDWMPRQLVNVNAFSRIAGTRDAPMYSPIWSLVVRLRASVPFSASRMLWVKRRSFTGRVMRPFSMRNVPSRVMPVMMDAFGCTMRTYQNRVTQIPRLMSLKSSALAVVPGSMNRLTANGPSVFGAGRPWPVDCRPARCAVSWS